MFALTNIIIIIIIIYYYCYYTIIIIIIISRLVKYTSLIKNSNYLNKNKICNVGN